MDRSRMIWAGVPPHVLNVRASLDSGQCFRWRETESGGWIGAIGETAAVLQPEQDGFWWQSFPQPGRWDEIAAYFALDVPLASLYASWKDAEPRIAPLIRRYEGMRILRQPAEETLFSFLCASCNTIVKIKRTVGALAARYGRLIAEVEGTRVFAFPSAEEIAAAPEAELRADLWGYRAARLKEAARMIASQPADWLSGLRNREYEAARTELAALPGIGLKIADCICLFGLWHDQACPIDTHVRRIAARLYRPDLVERSLTPATYTALADAMRERFGATTGWAQQYLFFDEIPQSDHC